MCLYYYSNVVCESTRYIIFRNVVIVLWREEQSTVRGYHSTIFTMRLHVVASFHSFNFGGTFTCNKNLPRTFYLCSAMRLQTSTNTRLLLNNYPSSAAWAVFMFVLFSLQPNLMFGSLRLVGLFFHCFEISTSVGASFAFSLSPPALV